MPAIATFPGALDATHEGTGDERRRSTQVIGVAMDDVNRLMFVIVDHDGRGRLVPAAEVTFTDDKVMPPKYG